jgi:1-deoxy-D-xylulose-5-phosphate synthase
VHMLRTALVYDEGPIAMRYPRGAGVGVPLPAHPAPIEIGRGEILEEGHRVALVGYGTGVAIACDTARILAAQGLEPTICDARFAKPLDGLLLESLAADHALVVTIEENVLAGGFGSAVVEYLADAAGPGGGAPPVLRCGIPDRYVTHGKPASLREEVGLTPERIAARVSEAVGLTSHVS